MADVKANYPAASDITITLASLEEGIEYWLLLAVILTILLLFVFFLLGLVGDPTKLQHVVQIVSHE